MYIKLCDRCGRKTDNKATFLIPVEEGASNGTLQVNGVWFGEPITLCNYCLKDFDEFRYEHDRFNNHLINDKEV